MTVKTLPAIMMAVFAFLGFAFLGEGRADVEGSAGVVVTTQLVGHELLSG